MSGKFLYLGLAAFRFYKISGQCSQEFPYISNRNCS